MTSGVVVQRSVGWAVGFRDIEARLTDPTGLEEQAALRAGEGLVLGRVEPASLELFVARGRAAYVMAAVIAHGHGAIVTASTRSVGP